MAGSIAVSSPLGRLFETNRALLRPRRLIPFVIVGAPMIWAQYALSREPLAALLGVALCAAFFFVAPAAYRILLGSHPTRGPWIVRLALYLALPVGIVGGLAVLASGAMGMGRTFLTQSSSIGVLLGLFIVGGWGLGRDVEFESSLIRGRNHALRMVQAAEHAQVLALHSHLEPHFLFNTLNAIAEWCREDGEIAEKAILQLSSMLRAITDAVQVERWPLSRELGLLEALMELHKIRDPERFQVVQSVDAELLDVGVPPLLLLPLVENAMKHGPGAGHRGTVELTLTGDERTVRLRLRNPGAYGGPREGGTGVPTLEKRLELVYSGRAQLEMRSEGDVTVTELVWPREALEQARHG